MNPTDVPVTEVEVRRYDADTVTLTLASEFTEHVDLTPAEATVLGFKLLAHAGRRTQ